MTIACRKTPEAVARLNNSASLRFVHRDDMEAEGYGAYVDQVEGVR